MNALEPNIKQLLSDLQLTTAYPENTSTVKLIQTHISWVFICDDFVYKLKKPVDFGFLDFTTLTKRKLYCHKEVDLNKRMAPDVYLGVYPVIYSDEKYKLADDPAAEGALEYAVKMRVLPDSALMKTRFKNGTLTTKDVDRIAKTIADFHIAAERSEKIDKFGELGTVKFNTDENFQQTEQYIGQSITSEQFEALKGWTDEFYSKYEPLLNDRIQGGHVRDCHGDLHMEHICLTDPIIIFDCIEFNDRFRYSDTASDLAFLMMDLDFHGGSEYAKVLYESYKKYSYEDDESLELIIKYYKTYRAYVRGKVNSFQLGDPNISTDKKKIAVETAQKYFKLALSYIK